MWGTFTQRRSRRAPGVLVDEPAEPIPPDHLPRDVDGTLAGKRWAQVERPVGRATL